MRTAKWRPQLPNETHSKRLVSAERDGYVGRVITGTYRDHVIGGIDLSIAGESQPIRCTGNHPIWSWTHQDYVRADNLQPGETRRTTAGLTQVTASKELDHKTYVYNIEVYGLPKRCLTRMVLSCHVGRVVGL